MKEDNKHSKCGYIAIVGRPNVGKSTLLNTVLGQKISIISDKPQTTRCQILGIKTIDADQAIYIDTPGLHKAEKRAMNRYMNRLASSVILDADVIIFMIEAGIWQEEDELVLEKLKHAKASVILAINKVDTVKDKNQLLPFIDSLKEKFDFAHIIPLSLTKNENVGTLEREAMKFLPEHPHFYPDEQVTDKSEKFQIAELIREKIIRATGQEIPYSSTVEVEELKYEPKLVRISAIIWVERSGQKIIIIGKRGEKLKKIGTQARKDIQALIKKKVFLQLWVKVKDRWTDDETMLQGLGY